MQKNIDKEKIPKLILFFGDCSQKQAYRLFN